MSIPRRGTLTVTVAFGAQTWDRHAPRILPPARCRTRWRGPSASPASHRKIPNTFRLPDPQSVSHVFDAAGRRRRRQVRLDGWSMPMKRSGNAGWRIFMAAGIVSSSVDGRGHRGEQRTVRLRGAHRSTVQPDGAGRRCHRLERSGPSFDRSLESSRADLGGHQQGQARPRCIRSCAAGRYPVILEPAAVAGLWSWMIWTLDAKSYDKGTSPFAGKLGQRRSWTNG